MISEKQIGFLEKLYPNNNFELFSQILERNVKNYSELSHIDVIKIVKHNRMNKQLTIRQKECIAKLNPSIEIANISIYKDWLKYVTYNPYVNLNGFLSSFNLRCKDYIIEWEIDREYGKQKSDYGEDGFLYYVKFPNFMCMDYDGKTLEEVEKIIYKILEIDNTLLLHLYQTFNGYHIYVMSQQVNHFSKKTAQFMLNADCDPWYIGFSYKNGFRVRVSKKKNRDEEYIQKFVGRYGNGVEDPICVENMRWMSEKMRGFEKKKE